MPTDNPNRGEPSAITNQRPAPHRQLLGTLLDTLRGVARRWRPVERVGPEQMLRVRAEKSLRESEERQAFRIRLTNAIRSLDDPLAIYDVVVRLVTEHLEANRAHFIDIEDDEIVIERSYANGIEPGVGREPIAIFGAALTESLVRGETVVVSDVRTDPRLIDAERARMRACNTAAFVGASRLKRGQWLASFGVYNATPRVWAPEEVDLIRRVAERTWDAVERIRAEHALRVSEERLRLAIRGAGVATWDHDLVADRSSWSPEYCALLGVPAGTSASMAEVARLIHSDDRARFKAAVAAACDPTSSGVFSREFRICRAGTGETRWVASTGQVFFEGTGAARRPVRASGIMLDITELKIREARDQFLLTLNDELRSMNGPFAIQETATRLLGEHLQTNRVVYLEVEGDEFVIRQSYTNGVSPFAGRGPVSMFGEGFLDAYRRGDTVVVGDVRNEPQLREDERTNFLASEIAAFIAVTLLRDARWVAALCVEHAASRAWTPWEVELTRIVAERIWQAVERARAEAALEASEHQLRLSLMAANVGTWRYDISSRVLEADDVSKIMHGFSPDQVIDTPEDAVPRVHPDDLPGIQRAFVRRRLPNVSHRYEYRVVLPDGETRWLANLWMTQAATSSVVGVVADITDRKRKEIALQNRYREQGRTLRLLLENAAQGILSVDAAGTIVVANRACETMFGWPPGELVGKSVEDLVPPALRDRHVKHRAKFSEASRARPMGRGLEILGQRKDGSTFPIEVNLTHVPTPDGGHTIAFISDITVRTQAERALAESHVALQERTTELERRTVQLSRLAYELTLTEQRARERLATMLHDGLQQLLFSASLKLAQLDEELRRAATPLLVEARDEIDEAIAAARTLSFELAPPEVIAANLRSAVTWLADRMRTKYGLVVRVTADSGADVERKDVRMLLFESLREILFNVVKHAGVDDVEVSLAVGPDDTLVIAVADQGAGFDPAALDDGRTENVGFGVLSIRERLALLGGRLEIESAPGRGARFRLIAPRVPLLQSLSPSTAPRTAAVQPSADVPVDTRGTQPLRILLVDDHPGALDAIRSVLSQHPEFHVIGDARNGLDAIAQAQALRPDVVLMDVSMPVMDGVEATRSIHAELPSIQIFGLSTFEKTTDPHPIELAGAVGYFQKGVEMRRLIDHFLAMQAGGAPAARVQ